MRLVDKIMLHLSDGKKEGMTSAVLTSHLNKGVHKKYRYQQGSITVILTRLLEKGLVKLHTTRKGERGGKVYVLVNRKKCPSCGQFLPH